MVCQKVSPRSTVLTTLLRGGRAFLRATSLSIAIVMCDARYFGDQEWSPSLVTGRTISGMYSYLAPGEVALFALQIQGIHEISNVRSLCRV
jgi:hypothetical protein